MSTLSNSATPQFASPVGLTASVSTDITAFTTISPPVAVAVKHLSVRLSQGPGGDPLGTTNARVFSIGVLGSDNTTVTAIGSCTIILARTTCNQDLTTGNIIPPNSPIALRMTTSGTGLLNSDASFGWTAG